MNAGLPEKNTTHSTKLIIITSANEAMQWCCHFVSRITAKVISWFYWNFVLWLCLPIRRTD